MLPQLAADAVIWILGSMLDLLSGLLPQSFLDLLTALPGALGGFLAAVPVQVFGALLVVWFAVDTALNAYVFAWRCYQMLPLKGT